ncbi:TRAP transporter small permease subunit [Ancylobacter mangrovi]|uniref:TRAP transporter small permease protein n=1 Tax=Ancylobacter mangrovi TaxID=2972472 RepID=A0A9X2PCA2_9HYPH|nr:TRAP transporter small permease [Ancylobacter mangrovi]MCS0496064.1 TRAP transporter small permease [Ancylobacter mangrovi]MCS0504517.1 TRAP transporter small permease [Ancylobacter mangrovi]
MLSLFLRTVDFISKAAAILAGLMLVAAMLVICEMIFLRYVFRAPTIWQTDFVVFTATAAVFLGSPYVLHTRGHVGVDVIELMFAPPVQRLLGITGALLGLLFALSMTVASAMFFHEAYVNDWHTSSVAAITLWIPLLPLPVSFALLSLQYVAEIIRRVCAPLEAGERA